MVDDLLHHLASLNAHPPRHPGTQVSPLSLNHTLASSPESNKPSQCSLPTTKPTPTSKPVVPMYIFPVHTEQDSNSSTPSSMSSQTCSKDSNLNSDFESLTRGALIRSDCQLWPWLLLTYNETTLRCLNGKCQVQTLNTLSLTLPNDPASDSNHNQSTFGDQEEESPTSCPTPQTIAQGRKALVTQTESPTTHSTETTWRVTYSMVAHSDAQLQWRSEESPMQWSLVKNLAVMWDKSKHNLKNKDFCIWAHFKAPC